MGTATLSWFADRGFELTTELANDEISLRFESVPVPADGLGELREGVELNNLDVLFKAVVEIEGQLGQVHEASVKLLDRGGAPMIALDAKCEDVETGDIVPFEMEVAIELPAGVPEAGGPRPERMTEDDLDFEDDTTLEKFGMGGPQPVPVPAPEGGEGGEPAGTQGFKRLFAAIVGDGAALPMEEGNAPPTDPGAASDPGAATEVEREPGDQSMGASEEARGLLQYLIRGEHLELEEGEELEALVPGTVPILGGRLSSEAKASKLGAWLLDHPSVADLYIGDEDLAAIIDQW